MVHLKCDSAPFKYGLGISNYSLGIYLNTKFSRNWDTDYFMQIGGYKNRDDLGNFIVGVRFNRYWDRKDEFAPLISLTSSIVGNVDPGSEIIIGDDEKRGFTLKSIDLGIGAEGGFQFNPTDNLHFRLTGGTCYITHGGFYPRVTFGVAYAF